MLEKNELSTLRIPPADTLAPVERSWNVVLDTLMAPPVPALTPPCVKVAAPTMLELLTCTTANPDEQAAKTAFCLLLRSVVLRTATRPVVPSDTSMPLLLKPKMSQLSIVTWPADWTLMPSRPGVTLGSLRSPLIRKLRRMTKSLAPAATTIPLVPATRTEATWPPPPSIVIDLVMVSAPKPPGSSASISPPAAVFEMAPANVLHGAVRLHGLTSSPTPETQVRDACACAGAVNKAVVRVVPKTANASAIFLIVLLHKAAGMARQ